MLTHPNTVVPCGVESYHLYDIHETM